jgi:23S rRNA (pseudouridine1915-N3)-methyltransferase
MQSTICAIGRDTNSPSAELVQTYQKRITRWPFQIKELVSKDVPNRQVKEVELLENACDPKSIRIALDRQGKNITSEDLAGLLDKYQMTGDNITFFIGGSDGFTPAFLQTMHHKIAFGAATWPHMLARVMVMEQLYRAQQILVGHPYHK